MNHAVDHRPTVDDIRAARERLGSQVRETPVVVKDVLTREYGAPVWLKCEHLQRSGSFKIRGALNLVAQLTDEQRSRGLVAASAGNHAQGVAIAGTEYGAPTTIFMPADASLSKVEATRGYGATVKLTGEHLMDTIQSAREHADATGAVWVHPFDDARIIAGQGTLGLELAEQVPDAATVVVPVGGGGLCSGIAIALQDALPSCRIVAVQSAACNALGPSIAAGAPVPVVPSPTLADGIAVKQPGGITFPILRDLVDQVVVVNDDQIAETMLWLMERSKQIVEGAGAAALAAIMHGLVPVDGPVVAVIGGGNIDPMAIMPVIRHGLTTVGRFLRIGTTLPDRPGELSRLLLLLAEWQVNVMGVEHRREAEPIHVGEVRVYLTLQTRNRTHVDEVLRGLAAAGYSVD